MTTASDRTKVWASVFLACVMAACFWAFDGVVFLTQRHHQVLEWMGQAHVLALDFFVLFYIFFIVSLMLASAVRFLQNVGVWTVMIFSVLYIISWLTRFYTDQFIDIEGLRFFFHNFFQLLEFVFQTCFPFFILFMVVLVLVPAVAGPIYKRCALRFMERQGGGPKTGIGFSVLLFLPAIFMTQGFLGNTALQMVLRNELSPEATLLEDYFAPHMSGNGPKHASGLAIQWDRRISWQQYTAGNGRHIGKGPVILIVIESMRSDLLGESSTMPNLFALKQDSLYFHYSFPASNESDYAWPAIMSSQYPLRTARHYYYPRKIIYPKVMIYDVLKQYGFKTAIFSAQNEEWGNMRNYLDNGSLDAFFDANSLLKSRVPGQESLLKKWIVQLAIAHKMDDALVVDHALAWMGSKAGGKFFVAFNFQRSHFPYTWPQPFVPPFSPYKIDFPALFAKYPRSKAGIMKNRYRDSLFYIDGQIGRIVGFLKNHGLYDQSLIVVAGDHGEAFYERGVACHAAQLDPESTHTFILFKAPQGILKGDRNDFVENIDIPPTICHFLGLKPHPGFQGKDILAPDFGNKPIFMTVNTPRANEDAIVSGEWKFIEDYKNGRSSLFNIKKDFMQDHDLSLARMDIAGALQAQLMNWRSAQLEYYRDPQKQKRFYPPKFFQERQMD